MSINKLSSPIDPGLLNSPEVLRIIKEHFYEWVLPYNDYREAQWFIDNIGPIIKFKKRDLGDEQDLWRGYWDIYRRCKLLTIRWLSREEIKNLLAKHFGLAVKMHDLYDLWEQLAVYLSLYYLLEERDKLKADWRKAIENNQDIITSKSLVIGLNKVPASVSNWVKEYIAAVGVGSIESIKLVEFLNNNSNVRKLSEEDKSNVRWLIQFYERLKKSSTTPSGIEETLSTNVNGQEIDFKDGNPRLVDPKIKNLLKQFEEAGLITAKDKQRTSKQSDNKSQEIADNKSAPNAANVFIAPERTQKLSSPVVSLHTETIQKIVKKVREEVNVLSPDDVLSKRLDNIVGLALRGVRKDTDTLEMLKRGKKVGGMELSETMAKSVLDSIARHRDDFAPSPSVSLPSSNKTEEKEPKPSVITSAKPSNVAPSEPASVPPLPQHSKPAPSQKPLKTGDRAASFLNALESERIKAEKTSIQPKAIPEESNKEKQSTPHPLPPTPSMSDVKGRPAPVGPIEELKLYSLKDLRRQNPDPRKALERIGGKIDLMEDESYERMTEGIRAWRQSPIYRAYVNVTRQSLGRGVPVKQMVEEQLQKDPSSISQKEFEAIAEFNQGLRQ